MTYYDVYCINCETVQATSKNTIGADLQEKIGMALTNLIENANQDELCCYNDTCMMDEDYVVRKGEETVEYTRLDDTDIDIR